MKAIKSVTLVDHDWEIEVLSYMTKKTCKQCGIKCHVCFESGWGYAHSYFTPEGDQIKTAYGYEPDCTISYEEYESLNAQGE